MDSKPTTAPSDSILSFIGRSTFASVIYWLLVWLLPVTAFLVAPLTIVILALWAWLLTVKPSKVQITNLLRYFGTSPIFILLSAGTFRAICTSGVFFTVGKWFWIDSVTGSCSDERIVSVIESQILFFLFGSAILWVGFKGKLNPRFDLQKWRKRVSRLDIFVLVLGSSMSIALTSLPIMFVYPELMVAVGLVIGFVSYLFVAPIVGLHQSHYQITLWAMMSGALACVLLALMWMGGIWLVIMMPVFNPTPSLSEEQIFKAVSVVWISSIASVSTLSLFFAFRNR